MITAFLRNDDVRDSLDDSLCYLTLKAAESGIPISHAVEPANVNEKVSGWLRTIQSSFPEYVEILQHGFDHAIKTKPPCRGEFGFGRNFEEQFKDINNGAVLMDFYFGDAWSRIFSFPYGTYDKTTLKAIEKSKYKIISTGIRLSPKRRILNAVGQTLRVKQLFGHNIVYFKKYVPKFSFSEAPVIINNTKQQTGKNIGIQLSAKELQHEWSRLPRSIKIRGILCHHRFNNRKDIDELIQFMLLLKKNGVHFSKIWNLYENMDNL